MGWLVVGGVVASGVGVLGYAFAQVGRQPAGDPASIIESGGSASGKPILVCVGDSITHGGLGADWVGSLRHRLADVAVVVNAGANGEVTWSVRQRLDGVARCRPDAVVLMVGTNDAVGSLGKRWASYYRSTQKLPQEPHEAWFGEQYDALVGEISAMTPRLACLTLPPLGEQLDSPVNEVVRRHNAAISTAAGHHGADVLDASPDMCGLLTRPDGTAGRPFVGTLSRFLVWMIGSAVRHYVLRRSWDQIAQRRGLTLTADTIHPSDRAGEAINDLVEPWARIALGDAPNARRVERTDEL